MSQKTKYILSVDQGTTGTTAGLIDLEGNLVCKRNVEFAQHFPKPGWVEHQLDEIWESTESAIEAVIETSNIQKSQIVCIGITNQRETLGMWTQDPQTKRAKPLAPAIVWQCRRTESICRSMKAQEPFIHDKTGLFLDPYFSASKIKWLLENVTFPDDGMMGTMDTFVLYQMTQGQSFATDVTNASRTMLMDLQTLAWDEDLCKAFSVPIQSLAPIFENTASFGKTRGMRSLPDGIPITAMAGDQHAALFGQACFSKGLGKCTYGTGGFLLTHTGDHPIFSKHRLLTTLAWSIHQQASFALEGSVFVAGSLVQWIRDQLGWIETSAQIEELASKVTDAGGVMVVPALTGMGAPHWEPHARGMITGIHRGTQASHIAYAALQSIALQIHDVLHAMNQDTQIKQRTLRVDGGACQNNLLMQMQADISNLDVVRPKEIESTVMGAGLMAGLGAGMWSGFEDLKKTFEVDQTFAPRISDQARQNILETWKDTLHACFELAHARQGRH